MSDSGSRQSMGSPGWEAIFKDITNAEDLLRKLSSQPTQPNNTTKVTTHQYGSGQVQQQQHQLASTSTAAPKQNNNSQSTSSYFQLAASLGIGHHNNQIQATLSTSTAAPQTHQLHQEASTSKAIPKPFPWPNQVSATPHTDDSVIDLTSDTEVDDIEVEPADNIDYAQFLFDGDDDISDEDDFMDSNDDDPGNDIFPQIVDYGNMYLPKKVSVEVIEKNTVKYVYAQPKQSNEPNPELVKCPICYTIFGNGDVVRRLRCLHIFHVDCVDEWICNRLQSCPVCRTNVISEKSK